VDPNAPVTTPKGATTGDWLGPLKIDAKVVRAEGGKEADFTTVPWSAAVVARALSKALHDDPNYSTKDRLDLGSQITQYVGARMGTDPGQVTAAARIKQIYVDALKKLPIQNAAQNAESEFALALAWTLGNVSAPNAGGTGMICDPGPGIAVTTTYNGAPYQVKTKQLADAALIVGVGKQLGVSEAGQVIAIMTGLRESHLYNIHNSKIPESDAFPNDKDGDFGFAVGDHDSVNIFQQRPNWGSMAERMDMTYAAFAFYGRPPGKTAHPPGLLDKTGWEQMSPGAAAQSVQGSAVPDGYDAWQDAAKAIVGKVSGVACTSAGGAAAGTPGAGFTTTGGNQVIVAAATKWMGTPYSWGGGNASGPTVGIRDGGVADTFGDYNHAGFDCSGLTTYAYNAAGVTLPRTADAQRSVVQAAGNLKMDKAALIPGDMVFFGNPAHHVGIYLGDGKMVNAPQSGDVVKVSPISSSDFSGGGHP